VDPLQPGIDVWTTVDLQPGRSNSWGNNYLSSIGRLRPGVTLEQAQAELATIAAGLGWNSPGNRTQRLAHVLPLQGDTIGSARSLALDPARSRLVAPAESRASTSRACSSRAARPESRSSRCEPRSAARAGGSRVNCWSKACCCRSPADSPGSDSPASSQTRCSRPRPRPWCGSPMARSKAPCSCSAWASRCSLALGSAWRRCGSARAAAYGATHALQMLLFGVSATDPIVFTACAIALALVALAASWMPARAATRVNPLEAVRTDV
jgi:hypothetical protein